MTLAELLMRETEANYAITERLFRRVVDHELSWMPAEGKNWMTMGQLLMHCANFGCGKAMQGFVKGDWGPEGKEAGSDLHVPVAATMPSVLSVQQALELLAEDRRLALSCIEAIRDTNLLEQSAAAPWDREEAPLFQQLLRTIGHLAQHKGQLFYYLKLMGKEVGTVDLWGA